MRIPAGFAVVTPYMIVADAAGCIDFLVRAFGAEVLGTHLQPDGRIANAQLRFGGVSSIMLSDAAPAYPAMPGSYYLYVDDADATMARAIAAGATKVMDVSDKPYGDRQGGLRDAWGNLWWVSQRLIDEPYYPPTGD